MSLIRPALVLFILLTLLTGGVYPLLTTSLGQWWFNSQANGSLIRLNGEVRGSALIGQNFTAAGYFQGRPSAAALWQVPRVAQARQLSVEQVTQLVNQATQTPLLSFLGQPVVNILQLNMALDALKDK
ncbi:TPA: potassium-transporting ATPase subunit C [Klebsiella pneumoniae]